MIVFYQQKKNNKMLPPQYGQYKTLRSVLICT